MWFGGSVAAAVERVAGLSDTTLGDSWVASSHLTTAVIVEQASLYKNTLEALGKPMPADFPVLRNIVVGPDRATAIREAGPYLEASYRVFGDWGLFTEVVGTETAQPDRDTLLEDRVIIGGPEECADAILKLAEATGCTRLITRIQWMGMDQRVVLGTIERLAERVMPILNREG
jgi:alkanesulfonate monooxygenase SsuD/methylene tetrahydromethanopterin reductase-like flavin-dependent oxidoreductase (luciferase family)